MKGGGFGIYFDKILVSEYKLFKRSDSTKTFDTVPHDGIRIKLREYGTTSKLWLLLYYMYTNLTSAVLYRGGSRFSS
jgi:hypothetical protein